MTEEKRLAAGPLRMLHVEDDRLNALLFEEAMRMRDDLELRTAESGEEAMETIQDWTPDLLVLDAHLPDTDGHALLARLRLVPGLAGTPAVMCSADVQPEDMQRAERAGFAGYWTKPLNLVQVHAEIDAWRLRLGWPAAAGTKPQA